MVLSDTGKATLAHRKLGLFQPAECALTDKTPRNSRFSYSPEVHVTLIALFEIYLFNAHQIINNQQKSVRETQQ